MSVGTNALAARLNRQASRAAFAAIPPVERQDLLRPPGPTYDGDLGINTGPSFKPEVVQFGCTRVYSSVGTAVARKNPLCLLDATFLHISF
jgi:hypothetical protein